jgi:glycosyltransferase involved in cell wall biosynthesis
MSQRISAIIHTLNEEANIANALRSVVTWADEIIVVDMFSDDHTVEIAESFGAKIFFHERKGSADPARAFAEERATGDWIIALDADEIIPFELSQALVKIAEDGSADICYLSRLNYFAGFPLLHTGWGPAQDRLARFYRRGSFIHLSSIHTHPRPKQDRRVLELEYQPGLAIVHFNYLNVSHCVSKLDRYTDIEAIQSIQKNQSMRAADMLLRPLWEFANRYLRLQGFRDGWPGFYYSCLMAFYRMTQAMKLREIHLSGSAEVVREKYQIMAEEYLSLYGLRNESSVGSKE